MGYSMWRYAAADRTPRRHRNADHHARPPASVLAFATLRDAWHRARGNQGCAGGDGETLEQFEINLDTNLAALRNEVVQGSYEPRPLLSVVVESPGKKPRQLAVPAVRDRVLQTAVAIVLTPLCEAEFERRDAG